VEAIFGIAALIFAAVGVVVQLKDALNTVWEVDPSEGSGVWLSLARQDEEIDRLLESWEEAEPLDGRTLLVSGPIAAVPLRASQSQ
jgi:hypothetical protein